MPFVGDDLADLSSRKRRRHDHHHDHDEDVKSRLPRGLLALYRPEHSITPQRCPFTTAAAAATPPSSYSLAPAARKMAAPAPKRTRLIDGVSKDQDQDQDQDDNDDDELCVAAAVPPPSNNTDSSTSPHRRRFSQRQTLAPCHVCHRRPTKKSDLDSFARCHGCREQTCFVCIRQCHRHRHRHRHRPTAADMSSSLLLSEQQVLSRSFHMHNADQPSSSTDNDNDDDNDDNDDNDASTAARLRGRLTSSPPRPLELDSAPRISTAQDWFTYGHCSVICSRCCVEDGPEGQVICLGCLVAPEDMIL